ncbi:uncharacterized protein HD556DRAFT_1466784 [Suillus plorans]|uniref:Uncharacterized protein n=1 Tax=Suillus plorans TaxID=116603 RepID=A0A9P7DKN6_9AGAM|nr:uncharacterized protein HD556DRAFT_1466784 [Suillus plorans]KAG1797137.1 hypothetical protein HD556DRAFT_1466784 [Suillus plorans]
MPSQHESDLALALADKSLRDSLSRITHWAADGREVMDQAHEIARQLSQALQQHGRTCSVISPFLLSAAAEIRATMNQGLVPQWDCVCHNDYRMESHPFFPKTAGYQHTAAAPAPAPTPAPAPAPVHAPAHVPDPAPDPEPAVAPAPAPEPAPTRLSVPPIASLPRIGHSQQPVVPSTITDKGKRSDRGARRTREDSPDAKSGRKKQKVLKHLSKAIISNTEDEDRRPTGTIIVKRAKVAESSGVAPVKSQGTTKHVKQPAAEPKIGRAQQKGKGKEKAVDIAGPIRGRRPLRANDEEEYTPPCDRCIGESCLVVVGRKGQAIKSCAKCHFMKVRCERPMSVDTRGPATMRAPKSHPRPKAAPASKSKAQSRTTRATSRARPPTPMVESEDSVEDPEVSVAGHDDADMDLVTDAEQHTDIPTEMLAEAADQIMVDQPGAIASVDDFPHDHWLENTDDLPVPHVPPTHVADAVSLPSAPPAPTILEHVLALTAQVNAMQTADDNALARVNAIKHDFDARISSMRAELSAVQLDVGTTVMLVNGLVGLVEKLRQERVLANPSFPPPMVSHGNDSTATAFGMRYLNGVFGPSIAPIPLSVGVGQTVISRIPDLHPTIFPRLIRTFGHPIHVSSPLSIRIPAPLHIHIHIHIHLPPYLNPRVSSGHPVQSGPIRYTISFLIQFLCI